MDRLPGIDRDRPGRHDQNRPGCAGRHLGARDGAGLFRGYGASGHGKTGPHPEAGHVMPADPYTVSGPVPLASDDPAARFDSANF